MGGCKKFGLKQVATPSDLTQPDLFYCLLEVVKKGPRAVPRVFIVQK